MSAYRAWSKLDSRAYSNCDQSALEWVMTWFGGIPARQHGITKRDSRNNGRRKECVLKILLQRPIVQTNFVILTGRVKSIKYIHQSISYLRNYNVIGLELCLDKLLGGPPFNIQGGRSIFKINNSRPEYGEINNLLLKRSEKNNSLPKGTEISKLSPFLARSSCHPK